MNSNSITPRERVRRAATGDGSGPIPFSWGLGLTDEMSQTMGIACRSRGWDWERLRSETDDVITVGPEYRGPSLEGTAPYVGVWGIRTESVSYGTGSYEEFTGCPLAGVESIDELEHVPWPKLEWFDFDGLRANLGRLDPDHRKAWKLSIGCCGNPLEIYTWMTGMEEAIMNMALNPELVIAAMDRISEHFAAMARRCAQVLGDEMDLLYFADDLGGQENLIYSRPMYREIVQPFHRRLIRDAKALFPGARSLYHTDGAVFDIIPDLIDAGVEVLEAVQTDAVGMDPARLAATYGPGLSFHGAISVQQLLPFGTPEEVKQACLATADAFRAHTGYIVAPSHAIQAGTPPENVFAMLKALNRLEAGDWRL